MTPVKERDDWEEWHADAVAKHNAFTQAIIAAEIRLNEIVYDLFDLTTDERKRIEAETKYSYGEV